METRKWPCRAKATHTLGMNVNTSSSQSLDALWGEAMKIQEILFGLLEQDEVVQANEPVEPNSASAQSATRSPPALDPPRQPAIPQLPLRGLPGGRQPSTPRSFNTKRGQL